MKKRWKAIAAIAISVTLLAGCGSSRNTEAPAETGAGTGGETPVSAAAETGGEETTAAGDMDFSGVTLVFAQDLSTDETANTLSEEIIRNGKPRQGLP